MEVLFIIHQTMELHGKFHQLRHLFRGMALRYQEMVFYNMHAEIATQMVAFGILLITVYLLPITVLLVITLLYQSQPRLLVSTSHHFVIIVEMCLYQLTHVLVIHTMPTLAKILYKIMPCLVLVNIKLWY